MKLLTLIQNGAVLSANVPDGARMLLAPPAVIRDGRLIFYDLASGRARLLKFDAVEWVNEDQATLLQAGDRVADLTRTTDVSPAATAAWNRLWLDRPGPEQARLLEEFRAEIEALAGGSRL
jgi:hypothetical protein